MLVHNSGELVQPVGDDDPLQSPESGALGGGEICGQQKKQTREEEDIEEPLRAQAPRERSSMRKQSSEPYHVSVREVSAVADERSAEPPEGLRTLG